MEWGTLTGIRPTKIAYKFLSENKDKSINDIKKHLTENYLVSQKRAELIERIIENQKNLLNFDDDFVNLYIHIPFCPNRCKYCSFTALNVNKFAHLLEPYLDCLIEEIKSTLELIKQQNKRVLSVYIGGGTPSVLNEGQLTRLLKTINISGVEYTFEAGRPDTITREKLQILKDFSVNRISINPQTFCDKTLELIGRSHTKDDTLKAFDLAKQFDFNINADIIAGFSNENEDDFKNTLKNITDISPQNITVHALSIKKGSEFFNKNQQFSDFAQKTINFSIDYLINKGYNPYYLYRLKNSAGNLENIGYCKEGCQSVFNITSMEETVSIYAQGSGAISKIIIGSRIERLANLRDVRLYIDNFSDRLIKRNQFLLNI